MPQPHMCFLTLPSQRHFMHSSNHRGPTNTPGSKIPKDFTGMGVGDTNAGRSLPDKTQTDALRRSKACGFAQGLKFTAEEQD